MDWGRSKTILILSFLCLNILLGFQLFQVQNANENFSNDSVRDSYSIEKMLELNSIRLVSAIPTETPKVRDLIVKYELLPSLRQYFDKPIKANAVFERKTLSDIISEQIPSAKYYELDKSLSTNTYYVMNQMYKDRPLYNVQLDLYAVDGMIGEYLQSKVEIKEIESKPVEQVMSASRALQFLIENYLMKGMVIQSIELGYHGQEFQTDTQLLAPKWRFVLKDGTRYYVHAINGEVEVVEKGQ